MLFTATVYRWLGRWAAESVLWAVVAYFVLKDGRMRRASLRYLQKVREPATKRAGWADVYRHYLAFARTSLDRFDALTDRLDSYTVHYHGDEHLIRLAGERRGAVLLGAHWGNFDMLRALGKRRGGKIHILTDRQTSQKFSEILRRFAPRMDEGVVQYDTGSVDVVFQLKQAIERGEFVGLLADRTAAVSGRGSRRVSPAMFLGETALFPQTPFLFAAHLKCTVFLVLSFRRSTRAYDLSVEPFAERIDLPEGTRSEALARYAAAFAARLEYYCRLAPLQWFNFYDFWEKPS
jgi:predicted LPLAT superfamily acyltransferase